MKSIAVLILFCLLTGISCQDSQGTDTQNKESAQALSEYPDREGWDATIRISSAGRLQAVIEYGHMRYFERNKVNYFDESVRVDLYNKQGNHTTTLTSNTGRYHESTQDIWAAGHVVVVSDTGITLNTPELRWDQYLEKIISDTIIMVTTQDNDTIFGDAFESNADLSHMIIDNPRGIRQEGVNFSAIEKTLTDDDSTELRE